VPFAPAAIIPVSGPLELTAPDRVKLRGQRYLPAGSPRATIALAHGMFEHQGRYGYVVEALLSHGYAVYAIDHRHHGASDGRPGRMTRFDDYVDDFDLLVGQIERELPGTPIVVLGHSMGGLIATRYALRAQGRLAALVLSGPALIVGERLPATQRAFLRWLGWLIPFLRLPPAPPGTLARDPDVERAFAADPLCHRERTRLDFARKIYIAAEATMPRAAELRLPLLVMHGTDDRLTSPRGSEQFVRAASSSDKDLRLWPDRRHEIFNDLGREEVIAALLSWLDARFPERP
jgi:alpha-beta hydrolase superfamily lysophospholipase